MQAKAAASRTHGSAGIISVDIGKKIAIWTADGKTEKIAPLQTGQPGFCTADFGWGPVETETPNLLLDVVQMDKPNSRRKAKKKPATKGKASTKQKIAKFSHKANEEKDDKEEEENEEEAAPETAEEGTCMHAKEHKYKATNCHTCNYAYTDMR